MPRPNPTYVYHFTHVGHLSSLAGSRLWCDNVMQTNGLLQTEVGDHDIKEARRLRPVDVPPGGVVGDYVPFYFSPLSPMLYKISRGGVSTYTEGVESLVFLATTVDALVQGQRPLVISDGNARSVITQFREGVSELDTHVDWDVIMAKYWYNTLTDGDRKRRRAAELLVHHYVEWSDILVVAASTADTREQAERLLVEAGQPHTVQVTPRWYY